MRCSECPPQNSCCVFWCFPTLGVRAAAPSKSCLMSGYLFFPQKREFLGAAQAELLPSGAKACTWEGEWSLVSMKETSTCRASRIPSRIFGQQPCAYQILLASGREGWTRAGNLGEFSKIFQPEDVYSIAEEHFDFWVLQGM